AVRLGVGVARAAAVRRQLGARGRGEDNGGKVVHRAHPPGGVVLHSPFGRFLDPAGRPGPRRTGRASGGVVAWPLCSTAFDPLPEGVAEFEAPPKGAARASLTSSGVADARTRARARVISTRAALCAAMQAAFASSRSPCVSSRLAWSMA